ncbi:MAG: substrate-binding domain-containing protein [Opitutales bacterium]|nr:substrate-binding domain-containing protein [Opitutales bacterium]MCH8540967.1 substrate-binding domain-containing protein [Opitutales bacterium]
MSASSPNPKIIAVVGISLHGQDAAILRGIARYAQRRNWRIQVCGGAERDFRELVSNFDIQAIIGHIMHHDMAKAFQELNIPVVNISGHRPDEFPFPYVIYDMNLVGNMAAEYFWQKGYRHFAVEPAPGHFNEAFMSKGATHFLQRVQDYGAICHELKESLIFTRLSGNDDEEGTPHPDLLLTSLRDLPRPTAIFVLSDRLAARLCGICQDQGITIPDDLAILGFGNFELICETAYPPLSSISTNDEELGRTAADLLYQLLQGNALKAKEHLVPPLGVVTRRSTDALAIEERSVAKAVHFIRQADLRHISCDEVALASGLNRRTLERKFQEVLGRSLYTEIQRWRCNRAKDLLQTTLLPMKSVAFDAGFRNADHMGKVLKSTLGKTPKQLRRKIALQER